MMGFVSTTTAVLIIVFGVQGDIFDMDLKSGWYNPWACPGDFAEFQNVCYGVIKGKNSIANHSTECKKYSPTGELALPKSKEANDFICKSLKNVEGDFFGLGAVAPNDKTDDMFSLRNNTIQFDSSNFYVNWDKGEPDKLNRLCLGIARYNCRHHDTVCELQSGAICEVEKGTSQSLHQSNEHCESLMKTKCEHVCIINNTESAYCQCEPGFYLMNDTQCEDTDECALTPCDHSCNNTVGAYKCDCRKGYTYNRINDTCDDINECKVGLPPCAHRCHNKVGSYSCSCLAAYEPDGKKCIRAFTRINYILLSFIISSLLFLLFALLVWRNVMAMKKEEDDKPKDPNEDKPAEEDDKDKEQNDDAGSQVDKMSKHSGQSKASGASKKSGASSAV